MTDPRGGDPRTPDVEGAAAFRRRWEWLWIPLLAGVASAALSWDRWIQPFVDSSRELQVPARLAEGERLYRDVAYYYGPAAPWINAAAMRVFGRRFATLEAMGALAAAVLFVALYRLARRAGSPLSAGLGVTIAAAICVGAPNGGAFLFPYAFAALFAAAAGFLCLSAASGPPSRAATALSALALAFSLLSKAEVGGAAAVVLLVSGFRSAKGREERRRSGTIFLLGILLAAAGYAVALGGLPLSLVRREGPLVLLAPPHEWREVYRLVSGVADPGASAVRFATALFLDLAVLAAALLVARLKRGTSARASASELLWWGLLLAALVYCATPAGGRIEDRLPPLLSPMPLLAAAAAGVLLLRGPLEGRGRPRFLLFAFSALLASRVAFHVAYGWVTTPYAILALPGLASSAAVLLLDVVAARLPRPQAFRRALAAALVALAAAGLVRLDRARRSQPRLVVETSAGSLRLPPAWAAAVRQTLAFLAARADPKDTLSALPEGGIFNFVTGLSNPLRQEQILPGHLDSAAEARVAEEIRSAGPRFFILVGQVPPGWAAARFGIDYGRTVAREIAQDYALVGAARAGPQGPALLQVLERRPVR